MFVADTHAFVYYLLNRLPIKVDKIFTLAELEKETILIPPICLAECLYLSECGKVVIPFQDVLHRLKTSKSFRVPPMNIKIIDCMVDVKLSELHDRIVVATALTYNCKLISKDEKIAQSKIVDVVWE
jgi:PIN domain nuclease of toxin-antitoxin system